MWSYNYSDELYHYGVKGMKWGVRRSPAQLGHDVRQKRLAKKDAKEFARAKMYYGEGAGNRRKLIKAKVNQRSKDSTYKKNFDTYLDKQDMSKHASRAKAERRRNTAVKTTAKTTRGLINLSRGGFGKVSASAVGIYTVAHATGIDKVVKRVGSQKLKDLSNSMPEKIWRAKYTMRRWGIGK